MGEHDYFESWIKEWRYSRRGYVSPRRSRPYRHDTVYNECAPPNMRYGYVARVEPEGLVVVAYKIYDLETRFYFRYRIVVEYPIEEFSGRYVESVGRGYWNVQDDQIDWDGHLSLAISR